MGFPWTERLTQGLTIAAAGRHSASQGAATVLTSAVDLKKFRKLLFILDAGTLGTSATVDFKLTAATTSGGTYSDITGAAITQLTQAGTDNSNTYCFVEVSADFIQNLLGNGYEFVKGSLTVATAASQISVIVLGAVGDHEPTSDNADASLLQTVVVGA